jgi:hypothetical protein
MPEQTDKSFQVLFIYYEDGKFDTIKRPASLEKIKKIDVYHEHNWNGKLKQSFSVD